MGFVPVRTREPLCSPSAMAKMCEQHCQELEPSIPDLSSPSLGPGASLACLQSQTFQGGHLRVPAPIFLLQAAVVLVKRLPSPAHPGFRCIKCLVLTRSSSSSPSEPDQQNPDSLGMRKERIQPLIFISNKPRSCSALNQEAIALTQ